MIHISLYDSINDVPKITTQEVEYHDGKPHAKVLNLINSFGALSMNYFANVELVHFHEVIPVLLKRLEGNFLYGYHNRECIIYYKGNATRIDSDMSARFLSWIIKRLINGWKIAPIFSISIDDDLNKLYYKEIKDDWDAALVGHKEFVKPRAEQIKAYLRSLPIENKKLTIYLNDADMKLDEYEYARWYTDHELIGSQVAYMASDEWGILEKLYRNNVNFEVLYGV